MSNKLNENFNNLAYSNHIIPNHNFKEIKNEVRQYNTLINAENHNKNIYNPNLNGNKTNHLLNTQFELENNDNNTLATNYTINKTITEDKNFITNQGNIQAYFKAKRISSEINQIEPNVAILSDEPNFILKRLNIFSKLLQLSEGKNKLCSFFQYSCKFLSSMIIYSIDSTSLLDTTQNIE
jgi:hypothetical protein